MEATPSVSHALLHTWTTVVLGEHRTQQEYREALRSAGMDITDWGNDLLSRTPCAQEEEVRLLAKIPVGFLGFQVGAVYHAICQRALKLGLELCPAEVGLVVRLHYPDPYHPEGLYVAMEGLPCGNDISGIFRLEKGRCLGPKLTGSRGEGNIFYRADSYFIFMLPQ